MYEYITGGRPAGGSVFRRVPTCLYKTFTMFLSKVALFCIIMLHFTSSGASPGQKTSALAGLEPYAARALYVTVSSQQVPASYVSGEVLYITISGSNIMNALTISDRPTPSASYVAPNGRLDITITGSNSETRVNYNGTPSQPAVAFLSINIVGSNTRNNINVGGSSVTADGTLRISIGGANNVNSVIVNDPSLRPADGRLQIALTGADNQNTVIVNGSPRQI